MILCQYFPAFKFLEDSVPAHLSHENTETMSRKLTVLPFPVLMKDQKKYSEVVDVLGQLEASKALASFQNLHFFAFYRTSRQLQSKSLIYKLENVQVLNIKFVRRAAGVRTA